MLINWGKTRYAAKQMPWLALIAGMLLYFGDSSIQGVIPHLNSAIHEIFGHFLFGKITGVPVTSVNIGYTGKLIVPEFTFLGTTFNFLAEKSPSVRRGMKGADPIGS